MWFNTFDGVFFITIVTIITGSIGLTLKYCLKSKCDDINCCCGLIKIHRIVQIEINDEIKEDEKNTENDEKI